MRRSSRIVNEGPGGIIANTVVEDPGNDIDFFRTGLMQIDSFPTGAGIDLHKLGLRAFARLPDSAHPDAAAKFFFYGRILNAAPFHFSHQNLTVTQAGSLRCTEPGSRAQGNSA